MKEVLKKFSERFPSFSMLFYIDVVLPAILYLIARFYSGMSALFHNYGLFVMRPIPNFKSYTGIAGTLICLYFIFKAVIKRNWVDAVLTIFLTIAVFAYFYFKLNYMVSGTLTF
ncbi:MAG: hypothetical protein Q8865_01375 [Bacillota bacterium]|nr:hypothetical protein [Bacillota bacterium]